MRARRWLALGLVAAGLPACSKGPSFWHRAAFPSGPGDEVADIVAGEQWIAVGSHTGPVPRWWSAADAAKAWHAGGLAYDFPSEDGKHARLISAARTNGVTAAVGVAFSGVHGNQRPVLWVGEQDALQETYLPRELFGGTAIVQMARMAAGPMGFLATGTRTRSDGREVAQVWRATSPPDWDRIDDQDALASTSPAEQVWGFDVAVGARRAVVVGRADRYGNGGTNPTDAAAWFSDDGTTWRRAALPDQPGRQEVHRVAVAGDGFVAVGSDRGRLAVWRSPDGEAWTSTRLDQSLSPTTPVDIAAEGGVAVAAAVVDGQVRLYRNGTRLAGPAARHPAVSVALALSGGVLVVAVTTKQGVELFTR